MWRPRLASGDRGSGRGELQKRATRALAHHWTLDPEITFLNHRSFGACPKPVLARQAELRAQLEREPVRFFNREVPPVSVQESRRFLPAGRGGNKIGVELLDFPPQHLRLLPEYVAHRCE